jgi:hypothetical protein
MIKSQFKFKKMAKNNVRVEIPTNPTDLLDLAKKVSDKHIADAANSPLKSIVDFNWSVTQPLIVPAQVKDQEGADFKKKSEESYGERDKNINPIRESLKASRDVLLGINKKNPKVLGQWGFTVHESVKSSGGGKGKKTTPPIA